MSFRSASAVSPVSDGHWSADIAPGWDIVGNANGGYVLGTAARAMAAAADRPDPVTVTAHYLRPVSAGEVTIETRLVRAGRRLATVRGSMRRDGQPLVELLGSFGDLAAEASPGGREQTASIVRGAPPALPPREQCHHMVSSDGGPPPFSSKVDMWVHPDDAGFATGEPSGTPQIRGWFRLVDGEPLDSFALLLAADAFPPTIFNADLPLGWTPTIELTVHVRRRPQGEWLRCAFSTRFVADGRLEADGELWDETGSLVAQSRQLALVPRGE